MLKRYLKPHLFSNKPLIRFLVGFLCILGILSIVFIRVGDWLTPADEPPGRLDLVVTFAGDSRRVEYSRELMSRYPEAHWLLSDYKNGHGRILQKKNYDMSRVSVVDTCKNTRSEVQAIAVWLEAYRPSGTATGTGPFTVGLVSSPYHMRRIDIMAHRILSGKNIHCVLLPVPLKKYHWEEKTFRYWWRDNFVKTVTLLEILKIGYFLLTGYF